MKRVNALHLLAVTALLVTVSAAAALAGSVQTGPVPIVGYAYFDLTTHTSWFQTKPELNPLAAVNVYDNTGSGVVGVVSSTDLNSIWGDQVTTTGTGTLDEVACSVYNSAGGPLLTANVTLSFYDAGTSTLLGSISGSVNFGAGIPVGSAALVTGTGLSPLNINLSTTNVLVTQQLSAQTGASTAQGVALVGPATVGTGSPAMYISSTTFGPAGFYTFQGLAAADPAWRLAVLEPTPTKATTWGAVKGQYR